MAKTFLQIFERYKPNDRFAEILEGAQNIKIQADKVNRMLNASVDFSTLVAKDDLYEIEAGIAKAFEKFPKIESLSIDTWGVDYVLMKGEREVEPTYAYRDSRMDEAIPQVHAIIPERELYTM